MSERYIPQWNRYVTCVPAGSKSGRLSLSRPAILYTVVALFGSRYGQVLRS